MHQPSQPLDRVEMWAVGRNDMQFDPAVRSCQPGCHQFRVMVSGIVQISMNVAHAWVNRLGRHQQHDRAQGIHSLHIFHDGLTGFQVDGAVDVQPVPSAALFHRDRRILRSSATNRAHGVGRMRRIDEDHRFISGELVHAGLVLLDETGLLHRIQLAGYRFRLAVFHAKPV